MLFRSERPRRKIEEKLQNSKPERALPRQEAASEIPAPERRQDKDPAPRPGWHEERRQKLLREKLGDNKNKAMEKRLRKGWRKNLQIQQESPRLPDLVK